MQEEFEIMPSDDEIAMMNREFKEKGVGAPKCDTHFFEYPLPIYMTDVCVRFCALASTSIRIISNLDRVFASRNAKTLDFVVTNINKNSIDIACLANVENNIDVNIHAMPIKQCMYRLLELHNSMSILLGELGVYVKSVRMQDIVARHLLAGSVLHGLCI